MKTKALLLLTLASFPVFADMQAAMKDKELMQFLNVEDHDKQITINALPFGSNRNYIEIEVLPVQALENTILKIKLMSVTEDKNPSNAVFMLDRVGTKGTITAKEENGAFLLDLGKLETKKTAVLVAFDAGHTLWRVDASIETNGKKAFANSSWISPKQL